MEATLTTKGQITLPKLLRDALHLKSGDKIIFEEKMDGSFALRPKTMDVSELKGMLSYRGPPKTLEEMDWVISQGREG